MKRALLVLLLFSLSGCATGFGSRHAAMLPSEARTNPQDFIVVAVRNDPIPVATRAGSTPRQYNGAGSNWVSSAATALVGAIARDYDLNEIAGWPIAALRVHCVVFHRPQGETSGDLLTRLAHDPRVEFAQPLNTFQTSSATFNDPYAKLQQSLDVLGVVEAHRWSVGEGIRIAVIDTGIDSEHPDLKGRVVARRNFVDNDMRGFERDLHGTQVAGVIAALANNREGIVGIAPRAQLLAFKACWHSAGVSGARCNSFSLAQALVAADESGVDIVNLSLTGPADPLLTQLVTRGLVHGTIFVGSVPPDGRRDGFPVGIAGVIAADSSAPAARPASVLYAPGNNVLTLAPGGQYDFASGSSLAAAHVTGVLALMRARRPDASAADFDQLLSKTTETIASEAGPVDSINACGALAALIADSSCAALASTDSDNTRGVARQASQRARSVAKLP